MPNAVCSDDPHLDCSIYEPCEAGDPAGCPREPIRARRARERQGFWSRLELRRDGGGWRHYLDGEPVHCGAGLELQTVELRSDDYGEYSVPTQQGVPVRYEGQLGNRPREQVRATLHKNVGGHEFAAGVDDWMRFRWPRRGSR